MIKNNYTVKIPKMQDNGESTVCVSLLTKDTANDIIKVLLWGLKKVKLL